MILAAVAPAADGNRAAPITTIAAAKTDRRDAIAIATATESVDLIAIAAADRVDSKAMTVAVVAAGTGDRATVAVAAVDRNAAQDEVIDAFKFRKAKRIYS